MSSQNLEHAYAVVLAGGSGTRLWPTSRDNTPKQFLKLGGTRTMLQATIDRILPLISWDRVIVVTNAAYVQEVRQQLPEIAQENIIAEPQKRDTALAMALGALIAQHRDPEAVVVNIASDAVLKDVEEYRSVITTAVEIASEKKYLLTVGITPTTPNVNFGYIQTGRTLDERDGRKVYVATSFKEKPDLETAKKFLSAGKYYWNANMYTWHVETALAAFAEHMPELQPRLDAIAAAIGTDRFADVLAQQYEGAQKVAVDVGVSEKVNNLVLLEGDFGWDDVGLWSTVFELGEKDANGSVVVRDDQDDSTVLALDAHNNLVGTSGRLVSLIGVEDMVVIDSKDVVLVVPRSRASEVKKIVETLKEQGLSQYL
jgi:mannose-1-phosphate guanylyltransferase